MSSLTIGDKLIMNTDITVGGGEVKTGATWNGKPVYCQCKSINVSFTGNTGSTTQSALLFSIENVLTLIHIDAVLGGALMFPLIAPYSIQSYIQRSVSGTTTNFTIYFRNSGSTVTQGVMVTVFYTKTTD